MKLITGRTIEQGMHLEDKTSREYREACTLCTMNRGDMFRVGVSDGGNVKLKTEWGEVVVKACIGDIDEGLVFLALGPWANAVTPHEPETDGMPPYKDVDIDIEPTDEEIKDVEELITK